MRFILNFFLFGFLFYLLWMFFPEAFQTLVSWATQVYEFFRDLIARVSSKTKNEPATTEEIKTILQFFR